MSDETLRGTSFESFEHAAQQAMGNQGTNHEHFQVLSFSIERGGVVGRVQYHATLARLRDGAEES